MTLHNRIREWLGINEVLRQADTNRQLLLAISERIGAIHGQAIAANRGMGRLIAKLDPLYGKDELSLERKAESDKLSEEIIRKLIAEHIANQRPQ